MARVPWRPVRISEVTLANLRRRGVSRDAADPGAASCSRSRTTSSATTSAWPFPSKPNHASPRSTGPPSRSPSTPNSALRGAGRPRSEREDAIRWLKEELAAEPLPSRQVQDEAEAHGIRLITLRRAFCELDGAALRLKPRTNTKAGSGVACEQSLKLSAKLSHSSERAVPNSRHFPPPSSNR